MDRTQKEKTPLETPITESVEVYPAGRGKILAIVKKSIPKKQKKRKPQPRFAHARIQANPDDITITEYLSNNNTTKHIYLFPEALQLNHKDREELALSLLATIPRYLGKSNNNKFPVFLSKRQREILKQKYRRYRKWRRRHN